MGELVLPPPLSGHPLLQRRSPSFHPHCGLVEGTTMLERDLFGVVIHFVVLGNPVPWHPSATWLIFNDTVVKRTVSADRETG